MSIKKYILLFGIIVGIFASYTYLNPLAPRSLLKMNGYSLNVEGMNIKKHPPFFRPLSKYDDVSSFFIHPSGPVPAKGTFTFNKHFLLEFEFSIQEGSPYGDIEFIVKKNGKKIDRSTVTTKVQHHTKVLVDKNDKIEIIADMHGSTAGDWGNLQIYSINEQFDIEILLIPFLWSLLFIFLFGKGHIYSAINSYIVFLLIMFAEKLNFGLMSFETIMFYTLFSFALTFLFVLIYQELMFVKKFKIATIFSFITIFSIYIVPLFFIIYTLNFGHIVTSDVLFAVFQTNTNESLEYISVSVSIKYILLFVIFTLSIGVLLYRQEMKETNRIERSLLLFVIIVLLTILSIGYSHLRLPGFIMKNFATYNEELQKFTNLQKRRKTGQIDFNATKEERGETYVVVIGESLNKQHMGVYGYMRDTTPRLSKQYNDGSLLLFRNAYPNYLQTMQALSFALTEANQYHGKKYFDSLSVLNIFNRADFETYWITNQVFLGAWDNLVAILGHDAKHPIPLNYNHGAEAVTNFDGNAIDVLRAIIKEKTSKNRVIFIHLMGSHVKYEYRYPHDQFSKYNGDLSPLEYGKFFKNKMINDYDNSVYYNDYVVATLLQTLQNHKGVRGFIYFSDHGEEVLRNLKHNSIEPTPEMDQIPMIAWLSKEYKKSYPSSYEALKSHEDTLFSNGMIYDTLIGMTHVITDKYNSKYDLASNNYQLYPKDALSLHGRQHYLDDSNYIYWREINSKYLINTRQTNRIIPNSVNIIGKLYDMWNDGFRSFSLNVYVDDLNGSLLHIGTHKKFLQATLKDYLSSIPYAEAKKILIHLRNVNQGNYKEVLERLQYLDGKFHIKHKFVIVFDTQESFITNFSEKGWNTSFHLSTEKIAKLLQEQNRVEVKEYAQKLAMQSKEENIESFAFDDKTYVFVKQYLEPLLNKDITYIVNVSKPTLGNASFRSDLKESNIYHDHRVKMLLVEYPSLFEL